MKKMKAVAVMLAAVMAMGSITGCGSSEKDTAKESEKNEGDGITLTLLGSANDINKPYLNKMFELYEKETGNKLDIQGVDTDNFDGIALTKFQTGDVPDLFMSFSGQELDAFNPEKTFVDFTDAEWVDDVSDNIRSQITRKDKVYGVPFGECSISGTLYNKKIFEEQNLEVPTTQKEFDQVCQKLLDAGIQPIYMGIKDAWPMFYQFAMDPIFADEEILNKINTNQITYAEIPEMKALLEWFKSSADKGYFGEAYMTDTWDYYNEVLGNGEAAMAFLWDTWLYANYDSEAYEYVAEDFGLMPAYMGTVEKGTFEGPNVIMFTAPKEGRHVEEATDFINFMGDPENYNVAFDGVSTAPLFKSMTTIDTTPQYEESKDWIDEVGNASVAVTEIAGYSNTDGAKCIQELLVGNIDVDECLKMMDESRIKICKSQKVEGF